MDIQGVAEPGFDVRSDILIGEMSKLNRINLKREKNDLKMILWMTLPRFLVAFLFAFGALFFAYSSDYVYFVAFSIFSSLEMALFYGHTGFTPGIPGSTSNLMLVFDLAASGALLAFIYHYFRQKSVALKYIGVGLFAISATFVVGHLLFETAQTSLAAGLIVTQSLQFIALGFGVFASGKVTFILYKNKRSNSRMFISAICCAIFFEWFVLGVFVLMSAQQEWEFFHTAELLFCTMFAACVCTDMGKIRSERDIIRRQLGLHVDESIVPELLSNRDFVTRRVDETSILFTDIIGFTEISEAHHPEEVMALLNDYFDILIEAIYENGGFVNKFMGDAVMAVWGAHGDEGNPSDSSVKTALAIRAKLIDLNKQRAETNQFEFEIGIGIHSGSVIAGHVGNDRRAEFSVFGPAVNVAARVEKLTRQLKSDILISEATQKNLTIEVQTIERGCHVVKGVQDAITVYGIVAGDASSKVVAA